MSSASCTPSDSSLVANVSNSSPSTSTSISTVTLGPSDQVPSQTRTANPPPQTANLDRFLDQNMFDDGTLHGRVPDHEFRPRSGACKLFYKARAAAAVAAFDAAFGVAARPN